ncbi:MAG TPA: molybdopterin cofactor-binding domain-containing protein [Acidimicrobiia bacterium]|jgi:xanthine dehydrogenase D subunit|nr:molybdopterin cofactor-binding domain-containing protein [Acidimicrobiia bacterium]
MMYTTEKTTVAGGVGTSADRPDGTPKVQGNFAYSSDLSAHGMLWGATLRSPHAHARITRLDYAPALAIPGVSAVLTLDDVPGVKTFGMAVSDQPVLADGIVRFWGEPIAVVAAENADDARRAIEAIVVEYEELEPLVDPEVADERDSVFRRLEIRSGDQDVRGEVVVEGYYETATQDQAPLGPESGLAIPDGEGGVDLYVATQWSHEDHRQIAASLGVKDDQARVHLSGIGGAFGAREDVSLQIHLCLLALHTGRPVKMVYSRQESFAGHVHRHPSRMWYRHEANRDGTLVRVEAKLLLDGGAYTSSSPAVIANATYFAVGPYRCESVAVDGVMAKTNNPPCGAMRGFGAVQACFGHETQMDRLAAALDVDPLELRIRNAMGPGDRMPTTLQEIEGSLPTKRVIEQMRDMPLPPPDDATHPLHLPGGTGLTTDEAHVARGVGYAVSLKNLMFSEAFDDFTEARITITPVGVEVETAAAEVGQGLITICQQIVRSVLKMEHVAVTFVDTSQIGSAGSTSASRQTQMTGGAVLAAATELRDRVLNQYGGDDLDERGIWREGELIVTLGEMTDRELATHHVQFRHPPTEAPDEHGHGNLHVDFAVAAHRAVVDVDTELGLVRVVRVDTVQDVGKVLNPRALVGQIEGGIMQGVGLAVMEELVIDNGVIRNANFTDYLLPTFADAPEVMAEFIEEPSHFGPFGAKGAGEPPTISSTPAVAAAIRAATGRPITRVPVRPDDIVGL